MNTETRIPPLFEEKHILFLVKAIVNGLNTSFLLDLPFAGAILLLSNWALWIVPQGHFFSVNEENWPA